MLRELAPGDVFTDRYRVLRALETSETDALHVVALVDDDSTRAPSPPRVLKRFAPALFSDESLRARLLQSARFDLGNSDLFVETRDAGDDDGVPWLTTDLLEGEDLARRVARRPLDVDELRVFCDRIGEALAGLQERGLPDGRLRPSRIFMTSSAEGVRPRLLGAGVSRTLRQALDAQRRNAPGAVLLAPPSPEFVAPELMSSNSEDTASLDVWAFGLLAFFALTGRHFWQNAGDGQTSVVDLLREILMSPIPRATERARTLGVTTSFPSWFDDWFARCVERAPSQRFAGAREALSALRTADGRASAPPPPSYPKPGPPGSHSRALAAYERAQKETPREATLEERVAAITGKDIAILSRHGDGIEIACGTFVRATVGDTGLDVRARGVHWQVHVGSRSLQPLPPMLAALEGAAARMSRSATAARVRFWSASPAESGALLQAMQSIPTRAGRYALEIQQSSWSWPRHPHEAVVTNHTVVRFPWGMFPSDRETLWSIGSNLAQAANAAERFGHSRCVMCEREQPRHAMFDSLACELCAETYLGVRR